MKKNDSWWYLAGAAGGVAGFVAMMALRKRKQKHQTKGEIIRTILTNQNWYISKKRLSEYSKINKEDVWSFFDNGIVLNLGTKQTYTPEQKEYDSIGSWTLWGKLLEIKWQGPSDFKAYKWVVEVVKPNKLRVQSVLTEDYIELTAF